MLDPRAAEPLIEFQGLTPRLDTLEGKNIVVANFHGGNEEAIRSVAPALQAAVPGCNVTFWESADYRRMTADDEEFLASFDGAIIGHNY